MSKADERHDLTVQQYLESIQDEGVKSDAEVIYSIMHKITGEEPILYGIGTIGFGVYNYEYQSGHKGEAHTLAYYPRKGKTTIYIADGTNRHIKQLEKLGKHTSTGYCIYIKNLDNIDLSILTDILQSSYDTIVKESKSSPVNRILWQDDLQFKK